MSTRGMSYAAAKVRWMELTVVLTVDTGDSRVLPRRPFAGPRVSTHRLDSTVSSDALSDYVFCGALLVWPPVHVAWTAPSRRCHHPPV